MLRVLVGWVCNFLSFWRKLWEDLMCEWPLIKNCVHYIFASLFFNSTWENLSNRKNIYLRSSFCSWNNQINSIFSNFMKSSNALSTKQKFISLNNLGNKQSVNEIWSFYAHRNHFFHLYQKDKSFDSKVKFRQASNHCKRVLEAAKLVYVIKT